MRMHMIFEGFPGKMSNGYMSWSSVVLVEHNDKTILFDTGGPDKRVHICPALRTLGVEPESISYLVLSHFHVDHVYNYDYFSCAEILLHNDEITYVQKSASDPWQPYQFFEPIEKTGRLRGVREGETIIPGVSVIHLPGHTPGSMGLVLEDTALPITVLAGDAIKNLAEMATGKVAMTLDPENTTNSIKKVLAIAQTVIPGHDRQLSIEKDRVTALSAARCTLLIPENVVDRGNTRYLELTVEQTWLPFANGL